MDFTNPVLNADWPDPDAVRVGDDYYLVASSFNRAPGLPVLHSRDLVSWEVIARALPALPPETHYRLPRHGSGVWAPSIRHHDGTFHITYPDPDHGIFVLSADDPRGPWTPPRLLLGGTGLIDPCPLWDDGRAYLVHGWARSRSGIANRLTMVEVDPGLTRLAGTTPHGDRRRRAARLPHVGRTQAVQARRLVLDLRPGRRGRDGVAVGLPCAGHLRAVRGPGRARAGQHARQRPAPGRVGRHPGGGALVPALPGPGRVRARRAPAADDLAGRLARHRRRRRARTDTSRRGATA